MNQSKLSVIKSLKTLFGDAEQFVITGSMVAHIQGLTDKVGDIDIVLVNPRSSTMDLLRRHVNDYPAYKQETNDKLEKHGMFIFKYQDQKVDVFIKHYQPEEMYDARLMYDGFILSPLMSLVKAKKAYHRLKDLMQLKDWASKLFKQEDFEQELKNIIVESEYHKTESDGKVGK